MLEFTRIDHICQVVPDIAAQADFLQQLFGFRPQRRWENADEGLQGIMLEVPGSTVRWELLQPSGDGSPLAPFVERPRGPGIHHVGLQVPALDATLQEMGRLGIDPISKDKRRIEATIDPQGGREGLYFRFLAEAAGCGDDERAHVEDITPAADDGAVVGVKGVDHICHAYRDRDELARWYERVLGMKEVWRTPDGEHDDLADLVMDVPGGQMRWEVIQPVGEESFIERFLETRGPAAHHVTFEVADWDRAMAACEEHNVPTFDENQGRTDGANWRDAFIHPKHTGGMLVQLFWEEQPGVWVRSDKIPSGR